MDHESPKFPLPDELTKCNRDETVCKYCGISYLIHHEIKRLQDLVTELEKKVDFQTDLPQKYKKLEAAVKTKEADLFSKLKALESVKVEFDTENRRLKSELKNKEAHVSTLETNLVKSSSSFKKLAQELCTTSQQLYETQIDFEKMKGEIIIYSNLKKDLDKLKMNDEQTEMQLLNEKTLSESLRNTVEYLQDMSGVAKQHIQKLEDQVVKITGINDTLNERLEMATKKLHKLKTENSKCSEKEPDIIVSKNMTAKIQHLELEKDNLLQEIDILKRDKEKALTSEEKIKIQNHNLIAQKDKKEIEIEILKTQDLILLQNYQETQKRLEELKLENENLKCESFSSKNKLKQIGSNEINLMKQIDDLKTSYEERICALQQEYDKEKLLLISDVERLKAISEDNRCVMESRLKEQESKLKSHYTNQLESLEVKLRQTMLECQHNESRINSRWNAKLMEYRDQMKSHVTGLERQIEISTNNTMTRTNQLLKERSELSFKIEYLETQLRDCRRQYEMELLDKGKKVNDLLEESERTIEETEYLKMNLTQKDKMIELLQETVHKECEEREDMIRKLETIKKKNGTGDSAHKPDLLNTSKIYETNINNRFSMQHTLNKNSSKPNTDTALSVCDKKPKPDSAKSSSISSPSSSNSVESSSSPRINGVLNVTSTNKPGYKGCKYKNVFTTNTKTQNPTDSTAVSFEFMIGKGRISKLHTAKKQKSVKILHKNPTYNSNASTD